MDWTIPRRPLGATGLMVSEVGFGALEIGRDWAPDVNADPSHPSAEEAARTLNAVLDMGINFIDTAPAYWNSEEFIGRALAGRREEFVLATKVGEHCDRSGSVYDYSREAALRFIDQSLRRLRTDRIDLIQIHSASMDVLNRGETLAALEEARQAGKVLHIGMSGGVAEAVRAIEIGGFETVQIPYNLLNISAEDHLLPLAREKQVGVIIMRPLAGGKLTEKFERLQNAALREAIREIATRFTKAGAAGKRASDCAAESVSGELPEDLAHLALGYVLAAPEVSTIIAGSRRIDAVRSNLTASRHPLAAALVERLRAHCRPLAVRTW